MSPFLFLTLLTTVRSQVSSGNEEYWTAFIDISYRLGEALHSEVSETGHYSSWNSQSIEGGQVGELVDLNGSRKGCSPPFNESYHPKDGWIALLERGECPFSQKLENAKTLGAVGVLVYDDREQSRLETLKLPQDTELPNTLPTVYTFRWKGLELLNLMNKASFLRLSLRKGSHCRMSGALLTSRLYCTPPLELSTAWRGGEWIYGFNRWNGSSYNMSNGPEKRTSVLFVSISFIVLMVISLAWLLFYYIQRFRYMHAKDRLERKLCSRAKRALAIISISVLQKDDPLCDEQETCAVCIETFKAADVVRILPCRHRFHKTCIDTWLLQKRTCPMCKMDILKYYGFLGEEGDDINIDSREETVLSI
eukprot:TRINITY_DN11697_c0_g1_i1.p1 TRINITY_DN11697_c0_g1~~TRINITY_DN11697_c0_g1_i1.p1  ORF type:complete len:365 (+),score=76.38 TRINITY_DN11697_c0_g1_i1:264-1358(+)